MAKGTQKIGTVSNRNKNNKNAYFASRVTSDVSLLRDKISEGFRTLAYAIRQPHRVISYIQLYKQAKEQRIETSFIDETRVNHLFGKGDDQVDAYIDDEIERLSRLIHGNNIDSVDSE